MTEQRDPTTASTPAPAPALPSIADGRERSLDPRSVDAARLSGGVAAVILAVVLLIGLLSVLLGASPPPIVALVLFATWIGISAGFGLLGLFWPRVRYRHTSYRVDATGIRIRHGVLWRSEVSVPRSRVQHTDVSRGPIERSFGLATLVIYTAGTEHASVSLGGLAGETAYDIRDHLITVGAHDAV